MGVSIVKRYLLHACLYFSYIVLSSVLYTHTHTHTQIKLYATTSSTSPTATPQRISDSYTAIAASFEEINSDALQSNFLKVWLHVFLILFPVGTLLCLLLCDPIYILLGDKVWIKLEDESNHATIAALVQVSVLFTVLVFMLDLMAFVTTILGDFLVYDTHAAFYLSTVTGMIVDTLAFLWVMFVLVKSCHWDCKNFWYRWMKRQPCNRGESEKIKKLMSTITVAPVLCFANHIHYIILALIADPFHAGGIIITYLVSFGLHYFLFKQFYNCIVFRSYQRKKQANEKRSFALRISKTNLFSDANEPVRNRSTAIMLPKKLKVERVPFNTQTVVFGLMILAPLILLYEGVIIALFVSLPISKTIEDAPSRLYSIYQGTGILIVALLTYNIVLAPKGFSISKAVDHIAKQIGLPGQVQSWNLLSDEEKSANVITSLLQDGQLRQLVDDINMGNSETGKEMDRSQRESRTPSHVELTQVDVDRTPDIDSKNGSVEVVTPETRV